jgi:hypothetical protein
MKKGKSNTAIYIGIGIAVLLIFVVIYIASKNNKKEDDNNQGSNQNNNTQTQQDSSAVWLNIGQGIGGALGNLFGKNKNNNSGKDLIGGKTDEQWAQELDSLEEEEQPV